ncbi:hypothetical protein GTY54_50685, partial [Streptomyces sp. SID625]|nr:hypothetical protein [Streptomyces sp. SID625]
EALRSAGAGVVAEAALPVPRLLSVAEALASAAEDVLPGAALLSVAEALRSARGPAAEAGSGARRFRTALLGQTGTLLALALLALR